MPTKPPAPKKSTGIAAQPTKHYRLQLPPPPSTKAVTPALVVEDGTGVPGANSYVDLTYAEEYHAAALYATEWTAETVTPDQKTRALLESARMIDAGMKFHGFKAQDKNAMEWPRLYARNPESAYGVAYWAGYGYPSGCYWSSTAIPERLKKAQCELAGEMLKKDRSAEWSALGISRVGLGQAAVDVSFTGDAATVGAQPFTPAVLDYLQPLGYPRSGSSQATVRRG